MNNVDVTTLTLESDILGEDEKETRALRKLLNEAVVYISTFKWCPPIKSKYMGFGIGGIIGVFLIRFDEAIKNSADTEL